VRQKLQVCLVSAGCCFSPGSESGFGRGRSRTSMRRSTRGDRRGNATASAQRTEARVASWSLTLPLRTRRESPVRRPDLACFAGNSGTRLCVGTDARTSLRGGVRGSACETLGFLPLWACRLGGADAYGRVGDGLRPSLAASPRPPAGPCFVAQGVPVVRSSACARRRGRARQVGAGFSASPYV